MHLQTQSQAIGSKSIPQLTLAPDFPYRFTQNPSHPNHGQPAVTNWPPNSNRVPSNNNPAKQDLPLRISAPSCFPDWPLFPRQGDFARHIKRQQHVLCRISLSSEQEAKFNAIGRHTVTLHKCSHLLTDRTPRTQVWQCSTSLFSLICLGIGFRV